MIDPAVFRRMLEASSRGKGRYTGLELLSDLNNGLFRELAAKAPAVSPYRRQVQRSYVSVLLSATGSIEEPSAKSANIDSANLDSGVKGRAPSSLRAVRSFDSSIAEVGRQYSDDAGALSEFRAVMRAAVAQL